MKHKNKAKVYLAGVGPGNDRLITQRSLDCIREADVIVYDRLMPESLLSYKKPTAKLIYVGKSPKKHIVPQEKINNLLIRQAKKGNIVVRLKGGDPFLFGRGSEEALVLAKAGIEFEIVPGVNSGFAAAAYAGIPLTHRGVSSLVTFVTGHEDPAKKDSSVDWPLLAKTSGTLVVFMGMARLAKIIDSLTRNGMNKKTPVCVVQQGSLPAQRSVVGTLANIAEKVEKNKLTNPAVIIIGKVVDLKSKIDWYEGKPLFGKKILVTRPHKQAMGFTRKLQDEGAQTIEYPLIEIAAEKKISGQLLMQKIKQADWTVFTSRNAVDICFDILARINKDARIFQNVKIAVIGEGTKESLYQRGIIADLIPRRFVMEGLLSELKKLNIKGKRVFIPHSKQGRPILTKGLKEQGALIDELFIYNIQCPAKSNPAGLKQLLKQEKIDLITFTSSSCVHQFMKMAAKDREILKKQAFSVIGPITEKTLQDYGYKAEVVAKVYTIDGLCKAIKEYYR
ncbi:MAG: uroporphyrinogen-III C-methyltransferase [Candidatus Omnitrophota bacterium]